MKSIQKCTFNIAADGKSGTMAFEIVDAPFNRLLISRNTHNHSNPDATKHPRHIQSSNEAVFVFSRMIGFFIPNKCIAQLAAAVEPKTTFAPVFKKDGTVASEIPVTYQWQVSDDGKTWTNINGETNPTVDAADIKPGQWTRCIATNANGSTTSNPTVK